MKKLISVLLIAVLSLGVLTSCGDKEDIGTVKEVKADTYVDRFIDAAKETVKDSKGNEIEIAEPTVEEKEGNKSNTTTLTYGEDKDVIEIYSNPETNEINGANLRVESPSATREADLERFFALTEVLLRQSDPTITDAQVEDAIKRFKDAVPDDPTAEGYTGMCTYTVEINGLSYLAFYDFTTDPASCEIILS